MCRFVYEVILHFCQIMQYDTVLEAWSQVNTRTLSLLPLYPPHNKVVEGYIGFTASVHPSVRPSHMPCLLCNINNSGWILSILGTNDHYHEMVLRTPWLWHWPISSRSLSHDLAIKLLKYVSSCIWYFIFAIIFIITIIIIIIIIIIIECILFKVAGSLHPYRWLDV